MWPDKFLIGGNLFTTPFNWIFGKIQFFENCRHEFHFCRREIDNATFTSAFFCRREIIGVKKTGFKPFPPACLSVCLTVTFLSNYSLVFLIFYMKLEDLNNLGRYDTIKICEWNLFKFSWAVCYRKICKNQVLKQVVTTLFSQF